MKGSRNAVTALIALFLALSGIGFAPHASAHGARTPASKPTKPSAAAEEKAFGREGDPTRIDRTIEIGMSDAMRFDPARIDVKQGETIRFVVKNPGVLMHEMVLGTMVDLRSHSELMKKHPDMEHDEPYQAHVQSGTEGVMVWQFTQPGEFYYACLIPGHFEAGMFGKIVVAEK